MGNSCKVVNKTNDEKNRPLFLKHIPSPSMKFFTASLLFLFATNCFAQLIYQGHSHNDYLQKKPLNEATRYGFKSIEIDVWLHDNKLVVSHTKIGLNRKKTLDSLYLKPLAAALKKSKGKMYDTDSAALILMIDFKNNPVETYFKLKQVIQPYQHLFMQWSGDTVVKKGVLQLLISGGAPRDTMMADSVRIACIDGGMRDTASTVSNVLVPRVSSAWSKYFNWNGAGKMPKEELKTLRKLIAGAHATGKQIRFWGAPDNYGVWKTLLDEGVDWVNTDRLKPFAEYYNSRGK